jgi:DNA polymerase V
MKVLKLYNNENLKFFGVDTTTKIDLPFVDTGISAGFPSPAEDFLELTIDLNRELIKNKPTTFIARVKGDSMLDANFSDGDLIIIDRSLNADNGIIAVCILNGEFTIKRIKKNKDCIWLVPENKKYNPIKVTSDDDFSVWGVITNIIKKVR